jgi:UDP-glucuronate 4-epimerase
MKILLTGAAGFIGMHTALRLLERGDEVLGIDDLNDYYDVRLKRSRLARLCAHQNFRFEQFGVENRERMEELFAEERPQRVVHLAAQAGVRYSLSQPYKYVDANLNGFITILEGCRNHHVEHLVYASSSSVYGGNRSMPFSERHNVDHPVSLYAATKKANELMAHTYSHLFRIPTTGLRFFTVYGPWGRPDMSPMLFASAILEGRPIQVFNHGNMSRDFTYIDDIVEGVLRVLDKLATPDENYRGECPDPAGSNAPYRVFNIGNSTPTPLLEYIGCMERALGREAIKEFLPMQAGDVQATAADTSALEAWIGFRPNTRLANGIGRFVKWYREHYQK